MDAVTLLEETRAGLVENIHFGMTWGVNDYGKAAHASSPEQGSNALDAVILLFNGIRALHQQLTSDVRIHGIEYHYIFRRP